MVRRANSLMNSQIKGKKRVVEDTDVENVQMKKAKIGDTAIVFKTPELGSGGVFNPPT